MPDKVEHLGEDKFVAAYDDKGISFRRFDKNVSNEKDFRNSNFTLLRQMAGQRETLINQSELGQSPAIKNHNSVMELIHGDVKEPKDPEAVIPQYLQSSGNTPHRRSSLKDFLAQHSESPVHNGPQTIDFTYADNKALSDQYVENVKQISKDNSDEKKSLREGYAKALFKSSHEGNYVTEDQDEPLQDIYKRLMKCQ